MNSAKQTTNNTETGSSTTRTVRVKRLGSEVMVIKDFVTRSVTGFTDHNTVIVYQGSAKRAKAYLASNGFDLAIPAR